MIINKIYIYTHTYRSLQKLPYHQRLLLMACVTDLTLLSDIIWCPSSDLFFSALVLDYPSCCVPGCFPMEYNFLLLILSTVCSLIFFLIFYIHIFLYVQPLLTSMSKFVFCCFIMYNFKNYLQQCNILKCFCISKFCNLLLYI